MRGRQSASSERRPEGRGPRRLLYGLVCSGALHATLFSIALLGRCPIAVTAQVSAATASVVSVEIAPPAAPAAPAPALPKTALPGGGAPSRWRGHSSRASHVTELAPRIAAGPRAEPAAPQPDPLLAEAISDDGLEVPAAAPSDGEAPASPVARAPDASHPAGPGRGGRPRAGIARRSGRRRPRRARGGPAGDHAQVRARRR
jgi:hypothetical protein